MGKLPTNSDLMGEEKPTPKKDRMSPIRQIMKAVTDHALNPRKKKAPKKAVKTGPITNNTKDEDREEQNDSRSAETSGQVKSKFKK